MAISFSSFRIAAWFLILFLVAACVDPEDISLRGMVDVIVVDGTLTNLAEPQIIRINRSRADPYTGQFGVLPITKAIVEVLEDSSRIIVCHETTDGSYQLPSDFIGQVGHAYQLRFILSDGTRYASNQQVMPAVPPISSISLTFNPVGLPVNLLQGFTKGYDIQVNTQDPADQSNYYRWDWKLWEKKEWCQSCAQGYYMTNKLTLVSSYPASLIYRAEPDLLEDCFAAPTRSLTGSDIPIPYFVFDYYCRTKCWEILYSSPLNLFSDQYANGGAITNRNVGQIPYYTHNPALVEVRQTSMTHDAWRFFTLLQQQTQNTGGLADTPPAAPVGNVHNSSNSQEKVVGYFTAGAVAVRRHWLDKKDARGTPLGGVDDQGKAVEGGQELVFALSRRLPVPEPQMLPLGFSILGGGNRPPTAICAPSDSRTPFKPDGWQD